MNTKLFRYLAWIFCRSLFNVLFALSAIILIVDFLELLIRTRSISVSIITLCKLSLAQLPFIIQEIALFIVFAALINSFVSLSKKNEYNAMKAGGMSLSRFICPFLVVSIIFMTSIVFILNPLTVNLLKYRDANEKIVFHNGKPQDFVLMSKNGILVFDRPKDNSDIQYIVNISHLKAFSDKEITLYGVSYVLIDKHYSFIKRLDAKEVYLREYQWVLKDVVERIPRKENLVISQTTLSSSFKPQEFFNSFQKPRYIPTWKLQVFIKTLDTLGMSSQKYQIYFYKLLAQSIYVIGVVFIAASFALKTQRLHKTGTMIVLGTLIGVIMFACLEYLGSVMITEDIALNFALISGTFTLGGFLALYFSENTLRLWR